MLPWNLLLRLFSFVFLIFFARFAYIVTITAQSPPAFCSFPDQTTADRRRAYISSVFRDLTREGILSTNSNSLCIVASNADEATAALRETGLLNSVAIPSQKLLASLRSGDLRSTTQFNNLTFDLVFSGTAGLDQTSNPVEFAAEISRILKPRGHLVLHTKSAGDDYSLHSLLLLFPNFRMIKVQKIKNWDSSSLHQIMLRKWNTSASNLIKRDNSMKQKNECSVARYKHDLIRNVEPLIDREPSKPRISLRKNVKNTKYMPAMVDISFKNRYIYIDIGAKSYASSIGNWFKKQYPKQGKRFEIYAIEADRSFHDEYKSRYGLTLLPYAAWIRNETLLFELGRRKERTDQASGGNSSKIEGLDFAMWLKGNVRETDYAVVKMDVEGSEFHLIPRLIETGAICLIDEMFLECHYNRLKKSRQYQKTYAQCLELLSSLRKSGIVVHQWG